MFVVEIQAAVLFSVYRFVVWAKTVPILDVVSVTEIVVVGANSAVANGAVGAIVSEAVVVQRAIFVVEFANASEAAIAEIFV